MLHPRKNYLYPYDQVVIAFVPLSDQSLITSYHKPVLSPVLEVFLVPINNVFGVKVLWILEWTPANVGVSFNPFPRMVGDTSWCWPPACWVGHLVYSLAFYVFWTRWYPILLYLPSPSLLLLAPFSALFEIPFVCVSSIYAVFLNLQRICIYPR